MTFLASFDKTKFSDKFSAELSVFQARPVLHQDIHLTFQISVKYCHRNNYFPKKILEKQCIQRKNILQLLNHFKFVSTSCTWGEGGGAGARHSNNYTGTQWNVSKFTGNKWIIGDEFSHLKQDFYLTL